MDDLPVPVKWSQSSGQGQDLEEHHQQQQKKVEEEMEEEHPEKHTDKEQDYRHVHAAITAIVSEDLEFFTPPPEQDAETQTAYLAELKEEDPMANDAGRMQVGVKPMSDNGPWSLSSLKEFHRSTTVDSTFTRRTSLRSPSVYSPDARQSQRFNYYLTAPSQRPVMLRSLSAQPQMYGKVFGSNRQSVERILQRMADAIRMDLNLKQ